MGWQMIIDVNVAQRRSKLPSPLVGKGFGGEGTGMERDLHVVACAMPVNLVGLEIR